MPRTPAQDALRTVHQTKAPTKKALAVVQAIRTLPTQADVAEFTAQLRREAGVQDLSLIQGDHWRIDALKGDWSAGTSDFTRQDVLALTAQPAVTDVEIHWPSLFQYGTAVFFTRGTTRYRAHTPDWGPSETYLSM